MAIDTQHLVTTDIPCFAVVGKVNTGKSAVLATLLEEDDNRIIRVSPEPGETTRCARLSLILDGVERLRFIDTPGFQRPIEAMRAIQALHDDTGTAPDRRTMQRFVRAYHQEFNDECRLLEPLLEGSGVIYVIDPSVPLYDSFRAEIEILRWTGRPRLALLNSKGGSTLSGHENEWREHLGTAFNLIRDFNALQARFPARRKLLMALHQIEERHQHNLNQTIALLDTEWAQRREQAAEAIVDCIATAFLLRKSGRYQDDETDSDKPLDQTVNRLRQEYYAHIAELERACSQTLLGLYRHTTLDALPMTTPPAALGAALSLARSSTWRRLGLTRRQLTGVGTAVGASAGLGVDAATLGHSLGLGTLVGGVSGGALAFFKGNSLPALVINKNGIQLGGGSQVTLGPPHNPNFGWVLLDSLLLRYQRVLKHTHGRRDNVGLAAPELDPDSGHVAGFSRQRRKAIAHWFRHCRKGNTTDRDGTALAAITTTLAEIEPD